MENNTTSSMSDKDKTMSERFDSRDSEHKAVRPKKPLKRSLFLNTEHTNDKSASVEIEQKVAQWVERQKKQTKKTGDVLKGILRPEAEKHAQDDEQGGGDALAKRAEPSKQSRAVKPPTINPNILSDSTDKNDEALVKMNDVYYRNKHTGKVILSGLIGDAVGKNRASEEQQSQTEPSEIPAESIAQETQEIREQQEQFAESLTADAPKTEIDIESSDQNGPSYENIVLQAETGSETVDYRRTMPSLEVSSDKVSAQEKRPTAATEKKNTHERAKPTEAAVQAMTMPELLQVAETIDVGSGSLKDMFEQRRIDAVNLRRIVAEYAAGRNFDELLHTSLQAEEMQRELRSEVKTTSVTDVGVLSAGDDSEDEVEGEPAEESAASDGGNQKEAAPQAEEVVSPENEVDSDPHVSREAAKQLNAANEVKRPAVSRRVQDDTSIQVPQGGDILMVPTMLALVLGVVVGLIVAIMILYYLGIV